MSATGLNLGEVRQAADFEAARAARCTPGRRALPDLPEHHRRRPPRDARRRSARDGSRRDARGADRHGRPRLDGAAGVEHPRRLGRRTRAASGSSTSGRRTCTSSTTACRSATRMLARRAAAAPAHACPITRTGFRTGRPTTREDWGFCLSQRRARRAARRRVRGRSSTPRLEPGRLTYGECCPPGSVRRRGPDLGHVCHPVARQRQPLGHRALATLAGAGARRREPPLHVPVPLRARARSARSPGWRATRTARADPARPGARLRRRRRAGDLQAQPARRRRDRPRRRARARSTSGRAARGRRLLPVRLRRAAVLLARASTCRSAASRARRTAGTPSTTPRPTTSASSKPRSAGRHPCAPASSVARGPRRQRALPNTNPKGEPQLGRRGLYRAFGGRAGAEAQLETAHALGAEPVRRDSTTCSTIAERSGLAVRRRPRGRGARSRRRPARSPTSRRARRVRYNSEAPGESNEGRPVLRRARHAAPRVLRRSIPKPMVNDRLPADPLAPDEVLRPLRAQGLHPLPGLQGRRHQELLPQLRRVHLQRLRPHQGRPGARTCSTATSRTGRSPSSTPACTSNIGSASRRSQKYVEDEEMFLANYTDGLSDCPLPAMIDDAEGAQKVGIFLSTRPGHSFHIVVRRARTAPSRTSSDVGEVRDLDQRRLLRLPQEIFDYIGPGEELVQEPFQRLIAKKELITYQLRRLLRAWTPSRRSSSSTTCTPAARRPGRSGSRPGAASRRLHRPDDRQPPPTAPRRALASSLRARPRPGASGPTPDPGRRHTYAKGDDQFPAKARRASSSAARAATSGMSTATSTSSTAWACAP